MTQHVRSVSAQPIPRGVDYVLALSCDDRPGIVAAVTGVLAQIGANITESNQFWDQPTNRFFMRIAFAAPAAVTAEYLEAALGVPIGEFGISFRLRDAGVRPKIVAMVSKFDHALLHLLYQIRVGWLKADVAAIVSNHAAPGRIAELEGLPFYHWPVAADTKAAQEEKLVRLVEDAGAELTVLARYMQIFSNELSNRFSGKAINIHHSFLPSFKGAKPYHQAWERGVKLIGATAHYVTGDLDEGPIIEQETERVTHAQTAEDFVAAGRDIESRVLARAVKLHLEGRVMFNGHRTIVF